MNGLLSLAVFLPLAGAALILLVRPERAARWLALGTTLASLAATAPLLSRFDKGSHALQFVERAPWIPSWGVEYSVGLDGISLPMFALAALLSVLCVLASWSAVKERPREFYCALLATETSMLGFFAATNLVLFYVFWELMLVPMFLLIGVWGGPARVYASVKFLLFTLAGSVLMLLGVLALGRLGGTYELAELARPSPGQQAWLFGAFLAAFAVKVPMFPVHTWLPDAHTEAPTAGSVILAGVLLKMGAYGLVRICLPVFPDATLRFLGPMLLLSAAAVLWGAYVTLAQTDLKRLIAYSSVSHMGFVTLGIFSLNRPGLEGALLQMLNHGIVTGALFLCVGILYERTHTRELADYGGLFKRVPAATSFLALFCLAASGFPGLNSFVGEFMILGGAFRANVWLGVAAVWGVALGATYMVWLYYRLVLREPARPQGPLEDLRPREFAALLPLAALVLALGLYPEAALGYMRASVEHLLARVPELSARLPEALPVLEAGL